MHRTKCACFTGPNRIPNRNHSLAFSISGKLILEWKFVKEDEGKIENISPFWHSSLAKSSVHRFVQNCLCSVIPIYMLFYILLQGPSSSQIPRKVPLFYQDGLWLTLTSSRLWVLGGHSLVYLSPQLWSTAPLLCDKFVIKYDICQ